MRISRSLFTLVLLFAVLSGNPVHAVDAEKTRELGLDECLQLVKENNLDLANAAREVRKAEAQVDIAGGDLG